MHEHAAEPDKVDRDVEADGGHVAEIRVLLEERDEHDPREVRDGVAAGEHAVKRSRGEGHGGDGGAGEEEHGGDERRLRGNRRADGRRFDEMRRRGAPDEFRAERTARDVEALGIHEATAHLVRLYETWTRAGVSRGDSIASAARFLAGFASVQNIRRVLAELESRPICGVYPLEVALRMVDDRPEVLSGVRAGRVISGLEQKIFFAGRPTLIDVPSDVRIKSFTLLGGGRPGYELVPDREKGKYSLVIDTPGRWTMALLVVPLRELGKIKRETAEGILELFTVCVHVMGKNGEPISPDDWQRA